MSGRVVVDEMNPRQAFDALQQDPDTAMVDVRTTAEWAFVGMPDLSELGRAVVPVEWVVYPAMEPNRQFYDDLRQRAGGRLPRHLFFICRSGARSLAAARLVAERAAAAGEPVRCTNVATGFEGDLDPEGHRGRLNGWKAEGLPWRQN